MRTWHQGIAELNCVQPVIKKILEIKSEVPEDITKLVKSSYLWRVGLEEMEGVESADILHYKYFNIISLV